MASPATTNQVPNPNQFEGYLYDIAKLFKADPNNMSEICGCELGGQTDQQSLVQKIGDRIMNEKLDGDNKARFIKCALLTLKHPYTFWRLKPEMTKALNDRLVGVLYEMMPQPPTNLDNMDFRSADGSDSLGKTGSIYARTVPAAPQALDDLPNPGQVFKELLERETTNGVEKTQDSAFGLSSLTFAFGTLVIHSVFHSDIKNPKINQTSSYVDLSPLYGDDQTEQDLVRNKTGRGLLWPDCFVDDRMLFLPPAAAALLVVFNRHHNYLAKELLEREGKVKGWVDPPPMDDSVQRDRQDEEIFQIARLINCVHFVNVVLTDYVGGIMGCAQTGGGWPMTSDPLGPINLPDMNVGRGEGNLVSIEFNSLYRWHATLSPDDVNWAKKVLGRQFGSDASPKPALDWEKLTTNDYEKAAGAISPLQEPRERVFAGLQRDDKTGRFADKDIAKIIHDATQSPAGEFRARGSPSVMGFVDIRGIQRARDMGICTLNEFRENIGLPKYRSFEEWNQDPGVAAAAKKLYRDIDRLELYPGLHAEGHATDGFKQHYEDRTRPSTMRLGLLIDAITLIRSDRFLTTGLTKANYTEFGYNDVDRKSSQAFGGQIHNLLSRTLGEHFPENNVFTYFPMTLPERMRGPLSRSTSGQKWDFERPASTK